MVSQEDLRLLVPSGSLDDVKRTITDNGPFEAPVEKGQRLGWVRFVKGDETVRAVPLVAAQTVERRQPDPPHRRDDRRAPHLEGLGTGCAMMRLDAVRQKPDMRRVTP